MTLFDDARYRWDHDPANGEYEFQFERFESINDHHDHAVFLIVDTEKGRDEEGRFVGDVLLPTAEVSALASDDAATTRIYYGMIEDSEIIDMTYDEDISKQRHERFQERLNRVYADTDEEN